MAESLERHVSLDPVLAGLFQKFADAEACWFSSSRPDGRSHLAPIWHVLLEQNIYVVTPAKSVRARNILSNPHVSLSLPDPMNVLIIEGMARPAVEREEDLQPLFATKYDWNIATAVEYDLIIEVQPTKVMAWGSHGEGRWRL